MTKNQFSLFLLLLLFLVIVYTQANSQKLVCVNFISVSPSYDNSVYTISNQISIEKFEGDGNAFGDYASVFNMLERLNDGKV